MCTVTIPLFKELIIMAFSCDYCGARSREVKTGGAMSEKGKKITFNITHPEDLKRDLFKSETAYLILPELELEM